MKKWAAVLLGLGLMLAAGAGAPPPAGQASGGSFQGLGFLSTLGFLSHAWDVSTDGLTVVGHSAYTDWSRAFRWTETGAIELLPVLPDLTPESDADGVSANGLIIAGTCGWGDRAGYEACVWTFDGASWTVQGLGDLAGGTFNSHAYAMSSDGNVLVGEGNSAKGTEACRWSRAGQDWVIQGLGDLPKGEYWGQAYGVSANGAVVVGQSSTAANGTRAFRWTTAGMKDLGAVARRKYSSAWGCSPDGNYVVGESFSARGRDEVAFLWSAAKGMVALGDLPGGLAYSEALAVSPDGTLVVGGSGTTAGTEAFIWDGTNGMRRLADVLAAGGVSIPAGWTLRYANGLAVTESAIVIVGTGVNPDGNAEAWRAVLLK